MSYAEHEQLASEQVRVIRCGVITISDTRTAANDTSGDLLRQMLGTNGHEVLQSVIVKDEPSQIEAVVRAMSAAGCHVILTSGGTGISRRDTTFEAIDALLEKRLPGFGELFRMLSYDDIGPAAMLSRATAGTLGDTLIFCMPGSPDAVRLGMDKLILPELSHLVWEVFRQKR